MAKSKPASPFPTVKSMRARIAQSATPKPIPHQRSNTSARIGLQIRSLRLAAGLSAGKLAENSGVSRSMLTRVERGLVSSSVEVLERIATGLEVPMSRFFTDQVQRTDISYVPAGKGLKVDRVGAVAGYKYELLGHLLSGNMYVEPYLITLDSDAQPYTSFQHPGVKFIHMVSGRVKYRYGSKTLELKPGDSLLFDARALHGTEVLRERPVSYMSVVFTLRE
jgi:transcriptional regulator with XRE-family HTH domain